MKSFAHKLVRLAKDCRRFLADTSGQAAAEYAMTTTIVVTGGVGAVLGWPYFGGLMGALNTYLQSINFVLNMALP